MNLGYLEVKPSPALQPFVDCYWKFDFNGAPGEASPTQSCLPFGVGGIIVQLNGNSCDVWVNGQWVLLPRIFMAGMYQESVLWRARGKVVKFGINIKPEVFHLIFNAPSSAIYSNFTPLHNLSGNEANLLYEKLSETNGSMAALVAVSEAFILSQLRRQTPGRDYTTEAVRLIRTTRGNISMDDVCRRVYISPRQLQRSFHSTIGTSPKTYMRIIRFRNAFSQMNQLPSYGGWAGLSYELGYTDQAHFIRDFKEFTGTLPSIVRNTTDHYHGRYALS